MLDKSVSYAVMKVFSIEESTVSDVKGKILAFSRKMVDMGMKKQAKVMKVSDYQCLDQPVLWFRQKRSEGI